MEDYLKVLNEPQRAAVVNTEGPMMVIAGAGSGKTRVLTYRIAHLMKKGVDAFSILSLTFTNKAAAEMKERISKVVGDSESKNLWSGTFHSVFAKILRIEGHFLGYPANFTIYDAEDARKVISTLIKEKHLDKEIYKPKSVANRISSYKNNLITPKGYLKRADLQELDASAKMPEMGALYADYCDRCFRAGAMDFDDLLLKTNEVLYRFPEVLAKYQGRFKYIMVDEYQDTNHSQYLIVKALASKFENVCVVGDDAQSIYAFRGANIRNILNFQKDYPQAKTFKLEQNYRSTNNIVQAANSIIKHNQDQIEKDVWTQNDGGEKITVHKAISDSDEGNYVAQRIFEAQAQNNSPYSDFAILYRTNAQSRSFEDALRKKNIPYRIYGGLSFYQRKEIKDLLAYVRLAINPQDEEAFKRVINYPARGIGATTMDKLAIAANNANTNIWGIASNIDLYPQAKINNPTIVKIRDFVTMIQGYQAMLENHSAFDVATHIAKTSKLVVSLGEDKTPEGINRYENVQELLNAIQDFTEQQQQLEDGDFGLPAFLADVALLTDADRDDPNDMNKVNLMTIHLAKGLEFPTVFVVGMEESLFPNLMSMGSRADLEEERRLFYVALTRAETNAYLTYAHVRYRWGKLVDCEPSRFIEEVDDKYLDHKLSEISSFSFPDDMSTSKPRTSWRKPEKKSTMPPKKPLTPSITPKGNFKKASETTSSGGTRIDFTLEEGMRVVHDRFGMGTVVALTGAASDRKATISFDNAGEKKLLLKFAKLQRA